MNKFILGSMGCIVTVMVYVLVKNISTENNGIHVQEKMHVIKDDSVSKERAPIKTKEQPSTQRTIKGYTRANEYIYKNNMKKITSEVQFTKKNTPYTIYSDGGEIMESNITPPTTPMGVIMQIEDGYARFFVPSNATQVALLVNNGEEQNLLVKPVEPFNQNIDDSFLPPAPPQISFGSGESIPTTPQ